MGGKGSAPKSRRHRGNADPIARTELVDDGELRGPKLPPEAPILGDWHPRTVEWWENWRRSPMAAIFIETDWDFLLDTAVLHNMLWFTGKGEVAELRLRVAKFGATVEDRARLRLDVVLPEAPATMKAPEAATVTDIASRRQRLTG